MNTTEYNEALEIIEQFLPEPVGYTSHVSQASTDRCVVSRVSQIRLLNPRVLYRVGPLNLATSLLSINREEQVKVTTNAVNLDIISRETIQKIKKSGKRLAHLGLIVVAIKGMTRKCVGAKVLVVILDKSWQKDIKKATMATMD